MALTSRNRETIAAVTRVLVPAASEAFVANVIDEVETYPRRAQRRFRWLFLATEYFPLISGHRRRFRKLSAEKQRDFLEAAGRHPRSPLRRLVVSFLKQLVYSAYVSEPDVAQTVGYDHSCLLT